MGWCVLFDVVAFYQLSLFSSLVWFTRKNPNAKGGQGANFKDVVPKDATERKARYACAVLFFFSKMVIPS